MSTDTTTTETIKEETIVTPPETAATLKAEEVDFESVLLKKDAEISEIRKEKENYRRAYLKRAKTDELPEDDLSSGESLDTKIDRAVQEKLLASKEAQAVAEKDALISSMAKRNKELTLALKNRTQINDGTGTGSNQEMPESRKDNILSDDQIKDLKSRGWDDKKIETYKKNLAHVGQMPK